MKKTFISVWAGLGLAGISAMPAFAQTSKDFTPDVLAGIQARVDAYKSDDAFITAKISTKCATAFRWAWALNEYSNTTRALMWNVQPGDAKSCEALRDAMNQDYADFAATISKRAEVACPALSPGQLTKLAAVYAQTLSSGPKMRAGYLAVPDDAKSIKAMGGKYRAQLLKGAQQGCRKLAAQINSAQLVQK